MANFNGTLMSVAEFEDLLQERDPRDEPGCSHRLQLRA
jgi:hypothetical protein